MNKICSICGNVVNDESKICPKCGNVVIEGEKFHGNSIINKSNHYKVKKRTRKVKSKKTAVLLVSTFFGNLGLLLLFSLLNWEDAGLLVMYITFPVGMSLSIVVGLIMDVTESSNRIRK